MNLSIDNETRVLTVEEPSGLRREVPLFSPEAFELISREWLRVRRTLQQYLTFTWLGCPIQQLPEDLIRVQEVIFEIGPDLLIETGVCRGGSTFYHATLFEAIGKGRVLGIDARIGVETREAIERNRLAKRIALIEGDAASELTIEAVRRRVQSGETVMVILDSHHSKDEIARELEAYAPLVTPGSCIIASWTHDSSFEAPREFAAAHPEFELRDPESKFNRGPLRKAISEWPAAWLWRRQ